MIKLEELHRPHSKNWDCYNDAPFEENHAKKSAEITIDVAVKLLSWCGDNRVSITATDQRGEMMQVWYNGKNITPKELFEEFINMHYGK